MADLTKSVTFRGYELNVAVVTLGTITGCLVDQLDYSLVDVRQFTEPFALKDGLDVGGVWLGARHIQIVGTVYGETRAATGTRIEALEALFHPTAEFKVNPYSFGFAPLLFTSMAGAPKSIVCRSNGLRYQFNRDQFGGKYNDPLAIPWSVTLIAKDPAIL